MLQSNQKTSLLVPYQLPEFIRDDANYSKFVSFVQAYYEWMEQQNNVLDYTKNLLNYMDVDQTTAEFLNYFVNDFMSYFPTEILSDKSKVIKIAKQLYQSKGTPASYQFLFRLLYNSDVELFYTKDVVLKASDGKWYVPRSLKLATSDPNFLNLNNLRLFGNNSKSIATVERAIFDGLKTEVFISNVERLFQSGEFVTVVDNNNQPLYFLNGQVVSANTVGSETLSALIVGQISNVIINSSARGELYNIGDPVVVYGGLNPTVSNPIGATVQVGQVTSGYIQNLSLGSEGYGYSLSPIVPLGQNIYTYEVNLPTGTPFSAVSVSNVVGPASPQAPIVTVSAVDPINQANVTYISTDSIQTRKNNQISTCQSNTLINTLSFVTFTVNPIAALVVQNKGGGLSQVPTFNPQSLYRTDYAVANTSNATAQDVANSTTNLANIGILAPIQIIKSGNGYSNGDSIIFLGGSGYSAYGNVAVNASGSIVTAQYIANTQNPMPLGGAGYNFALPSAVIAHLATGTITTNTSSNVIVGTGTSFTTQFINGAKLVTNTNVVIGTVQSVLNANVMYLTSNSIANVTSNGFYLGTAILSVPGTLGTGATASATTSRIGAITSFNVIEYGEDYIAAPNVSLKVQDLLVTNVSPTNLPSAGDVIYQGANVNTASYIATVDSIFAIENFNPPTNSVYQLRVYNYTSRPRQNVGGQIVTINNDTSGYHLNLVSGFNLQGRTTFDLLDSRFDSANGYITYGDGHAKANVTFLNGLVIGQGQYLDTSGQPSSYDVLQSTVYNNYTYEITLNTEIAKYRDALLNLLHPTGTQVIGRMAMYSNTSTRYATNDYLSTANTIGLNNYSSATITAGTPAVPSNNIVKIVPIGTNNIANVFVANSSTLRFIFGSGVTDFVSSSVITVNPTANTVTLKDNVWTYVANVARAVAQAGNNYILNIASSSVNTAVWNIINNGNYSNTAYPLSDIIHVGDTV
jgi:hypothetical protein